MINRETLNKLTFGFFSKGHQRSILLKKNITASFLIKGTSIAIGLALVPMMINYLEPTRYGIWITLSSIIGWFGFFDIGLGHGLRNRFAESLAKGKHSLAKAYVSTTYAILAFIVVVVLLFFYTINPLLNWNKLLNAGQDIVLEKELSLLAIIVFTFFCLRFFFKLITTILTADQRPAKASLFDLIGKSLALFFIYILTKTTDSSLLYFGIVMSGMPVFVLLISSIWFFNGRYKLYKPSIRYVDLSKAKDLFSLGVKFFIIHISAILLYQTNNIIISHLFGPEQVAPYHVAFKYFSVLMMAYTIVIMPFWSAFTEAWVKDEKEWIRRIVKKLVYLWLLFLLIAIVMFVSSKFIYQLWIGEVVDIPYSISALVAIWILLNTFSGIFSQFLNGVGKIKIQLTLAFTLAVLNIPLAITFGKLIGVEGVLLANVLLSFITIWLYPLQYKKIMNNTAKGVWYK